MIDAILSIPPILALQVYACIAVAIAAGIPTVIVITSMNYQEYWNDDTLDDVGTMIAFISIGWPLGLIFLLIYGFVRAVFALNILTVRWVERTYKTLRKKG